jgi:dienelactone hydrolase
VKLQVIATAFALAALTGCVTGNTQSVQYATAALPGLSRPATINAEIYRPQGPGPFPAVIVLNGCGGISDHERNWAQTLNSWGYVAMVVDSFRSRGYGNICTNTSAVTPTDRISDIIGAAETLKSQPYVQKDHLGLIGFSHGGWTVLKAVQEQYELKDYGIQAAVGYYPYCDPKHDTKVALPLLILMGAEDTWVHTERCQKLQANKALKHPELIKAIYYPNTYHSFDRPGPVQEIPGTGVGGVVTMQRIGYNAKSAEDAAKQAHAFFDQHLKAGQ